MFCFWSDKQTRHTNRIQRRVIKIKEVERLRLFEEPDLHAPRGDHCDNLEPESPKNDQKSEKQKQRDGNCCSL